MHRALKPVLLLVLSHTAAGARVRPAPPRRAARAPPPPVDLPPSATEGAALRACAAGWAAVCGYAYDTERSRSLVSAVFDLPTNTFEDLIREPAAGLRGASSEVCAFAPSCFG